MYGIASHKVADAHRAAGRNRSDPTDEVPERFSVDDGPEQMAINFDSAARMQKLLAVLPDGGSITGAMHDLRGNSSRRISHGPLPAAWPVVGSGGLPAGTAPAQMMVEKNAGAARAVRDALDAVGGSGSPAGSALWYVAGLQMSIRDWALRDGWNGKRVEKNEAKGILVAALGVLARYYGYERAPKPRGETSTHA